MLLVSSFLNFLKFCWSIVDLQCCVNFCCMVKWFSCIYIFFFIFFSFMVYHRILKQAFWTPLDFYASGIWHWLFALPASLRWPNSGCFFSAPGPVDRAPIPQDNSNIRYIWEAYESWKGEPLEWRCGKQITSTVLTSYLRTQQQTFYSQPCFLHYNSSNSLMDIQQRKHNYDMRFRAQSFWASSATTTLRVWCKPLGFSEFHYPLK